MEMSRAAVIPMPGLPPEIRHYPIPELESGGILLKTIASEVCGTATTRYLGVYGGR